MIEKEEEGKSYIKKNYWKLKVGEFTLTVPSRHLKISRNTWNIWHHGRASNVIILPCTKHHEMSTITIYFLCSDPFMTLCLCAYTQHWRCHRTQKSKGTLRQQCPHMQSKCVCKATSREGLAEDESLLAYLSVYGISGKLSCACGL